jgi:hypothetical protein
MTAVRRSAPSRKDEDMFVVAVHGIKFLKRKLRVGETGYEFCLGEIVNPACGKTYRRNSQASRLL